MSKIVSLCCMFVVYVYTGHVIWDDAVTASSRGCYWRECCYMGHFTGTDKFLSAQEYHSQMVFFCLNLTSLIIFQGHDVIAVINIPNLKCLTWYMCVKYVPHIPPTLEKCMSQGYKFNFKLKFVFYFQVRVL